ncbi:MAG: hypothetical protein ACXWUQ_03485 [Allosphingosinicella sp.]
MAVSIFADEAVAGQPPIIVAIAPTSVGVRVAYTLPTPARSLPLHMPKQARPALNVIVEGEGFALEDGQIKATRPFTRVSLMVSPDSREVDSVYPLLLPVRGKGFVIHAPYLSPVGAPSVTKVAGADGTYRTVRKQAANGYLLVGAELQNSGPFRSLVSEGAPALLRETVLDRAKRLLNFYTSELGERPERRPTIIVSYSKRPDGAKRDFFRGDVTANGVVFLRIYAEDGGNADTASVAEYTGFLSHELFHLWNRSNDPTTENWWLHEGGAEYASWVATSRLWPSETSLERRVGDALLSCTMYLGGRPLSSLADPETRSVRYPCGAVIQWLADLGVRASDRKQNSFALWRRLLAKRKSAGSYTPADFQALLAALAPKAVLPVRAILSESGVERWRGLADSANAMGARVEVNAPAPFLLRLAAARPLVLSSCNEIWGVGENQNKLFVQAPESCTTFGDSPIIELAGGVSPMGDANGFYETVRSACAAKSEIELSLTANGTSRSGRVKCTAPVDPPPPDLKVVRALPAP